MVKLNKSLISGSIILLVTFGIFNVINYLYHFSMARMLSIAEYGTLATLFAIIYITSIFGESIQTVIAKYSSNEKEPGKLKNLFKRSLRKSSVFSSLIFLFYLLISWPLSFFLKIPYSLLALNGLIIFVWFFIPITRGIFQGRKMFSSLGSSMILEALIKLSLGVFLVFIGWKIYGAILAAILATVMAFFYSLFTLREILKSKEKPATTKDIYKYSRPVFLIFLCLLIFYNIDIIIAKIVFNSDIAGIYALTSILAKTIFFVTQPIGRAMFPLTAEEKAIKKKDNLFVNAFIFLSIIVITALFAFYLFPDLLVKIFTGKVIPESVKILFYLAIAASILSYANLILLYKLSFGKTKGYPLFFIFVIFEVFLLFYFSATLVQFSLAFITASAIFLWGSVFLLNE